MEIAQKFTRDEYTSALKGISDGIAQLGPVKPIKALRQTEKAKQLSRSDIYCRILNARDSVCAKTTVDGEVLYVDELISLVLLFFNGMFSHLAQDFRTLEKFEDGLSSYHSVRNRLAHRESIRIHFEEAIESLETAALVLRGIPDTCLWQTARPELNRFIVAANDALLQVIPVRNNLDRVPKKHTSLLMRDSEMADLRRRLRGNALSGRVAGSVELHGYGGVGKTALALEYCLEVIRDEMNDRRDVCHFVLWLSSKTEELVLRGASRELTIKPIEPLYSEANEIVTQLGTLLAVEPGSTEAVLEHVKSHQIKGLIVLDNLETLAVEEKNKTQALIRQFPRDIQFIITSRNYEGIAEEDILVRCFKDAKQGTLFVSSYCEDKGYQLDVPENQMQTFIEDTQGNTLLLVLGVERIVSGESIETVIDDLEQLTDREMDLVVDFMYKRTFDSAIDKAREIGHGVDVRKLISVMFLYQERIDVPSLRELLDFPPVSALSHVLSVLQDKYVIQRTKDYFQLHEFAERFVFLRLLPDPVERRQLANKISDYKRRVRADLGRLNDEMRRNPELAAIIEEWRPETELEDIAIARSHALYGDAKVDLRGVESLENLAEYLATLHQRLRKLDVLSDHPYVSFEKGRILGLVLQHELTRTEPALERRLNEEIEEAYETTRTLILNRRLLTRSENYAAFLWIYGIHLSNAGKLGEAANILEESIRCFESLGAPRKPETMVQIDTLLASVYCKRYLEAGEELYLNRAKAIYLSYQHGNGRTPRVLRLVGIFADVCLNSYRLPQVRNALAAIGSVAEPYKFLKTHIQKQLEIAQ